MLDCGRIPLKYALRKAYNIKINGRARAWQKNYGETLRFLQKTKKEDDHEPTDI